MAYKETKPDSKLYQGPVEELCGNPSERSGDGAVNGGVDGLPKESGGTPTVTYTKVDGK